MWLQDDGGPEPAHMSERTGTSDLMSAINAQLPNGLVYVGKAVFEQVLSCEFYLSDAINDSYITTAALYAAQREPSTRSSGAI